MIHNIRFYRQSKTVKSTAASQKMQKLKDLEKTASPSWFVDFKDSLNHQYS
jgi:hypothetical protein